MIRSIDIPLDTAAPRLARQTIADVARSADVPPRVVDDATLLVSELVTNSLRHGVGPGVRVIVEVTDDGAMRCEVVDAGHGFVPEARDQSSPDPGGWGLGLVESMASAWGVREGSTHVWFELTP